MKKNPYERPDRWTNEDEELIIADVMTEISDLWEVLSQLESFADIRCLAMANAKLEECCMWARRACDVSER